MSPPAMDKYPTDDWGAIAESAPSDKQQCPSGIHFKGPSDLHHGLHRLPHLWKVCRTDSG